MKYNMINTQRSNLKIKKRILKLKISGLFRIKFKIMFFS